MRKYFSLLIHTEFYYLTNFNQNKRFKKKMRKINFRPMSALNIRIEFANMIKADSQMF